MKYAYLSALFCVAIAASTGHCQTSVPIINPTFNADTVPFGGWTYISREGLATNPLTGWTVNAAGPIVDLRDPAYPVAPVAGQDATQFVEELNWDQLGLTSTVTISQVLTTSFVAGAYYELTADAAIYSNPGMPAPAAEVGDTFFIANSSGTVLASATISDLTLDAFSQFTVRFTSTGLLGDTGPIEIGYASPASQPTGQDYMEIDNFALTAVPEPSSIAIAALSSFGVLSIVLRRRV